MSQREVFRRLLWKDFVIVRSLSWSVIGLLLALNLLILFFGSAGDLTDRGMADTSIAVWIVIPNLFSLGAPVLLIGSEEEAGTNDWLRTLPIRWESIWASRCFVVLGTALLIWLIATAALCLLGLIWQRTVSWEHEMGIEGVLLTAFFSALLPLVSFLCSYAVRSPLLAKGIFVVVYSVAGIIFGTLFQLSDGWIEVVAVGVIGLFVFWFAARMMAKNRMTAPIATRRLSFDSGGGTTFRAPRSSLGPRPSPIGSLLWQQVQQSWPVSLVVVSLSLFTALLFRYTHPLREFDLVALAGSFAPGFVILGASTLGATVFYGDNVRRRCGFFADRGISPGQIWWTRLLPLAVACVSLMLAVAMIAIATAQNGYSVTESFVNYGVAVLVAFAFGQLVSQWVDRPILAFFAAPAYAVVCLSPLIYLIERFNYPWQVLALTSPVLFIATWSLTQRWLEGRDRTSFSARVFGYTALAVLLPCLVVVTDRSGALRGWLRSAASAIEAADELEPTTLVATRPTEIAP